jgi:hypothetical protein
MLIAHYKKTQIAWAPEAICNVINKYTEHHAYMVGYSYPISKIFPNTDVVHQHNTDEVIHPFKVIQYHSEPFKVDLNTKTKKLVIAQYHATLPEYKDCTLVRNPIDIYDTAYFPLYVQDKIRIGYSPSTINPQTKWADKGYKETIPILEEIKNIYHGIVEVDIISGVSLAECLKRKSRVNIFIDEVVTSSYHRSGLESLAMGIVTICSLDKSVENILLKASGANDIPFINTSSIQLKSCLISLIEGGIEKILNLGYKNRIWMEKYWNPNDLTEEYINIYKTIIAKST